MDLLYEIKAAHLMTENHNPLPFVHPNSESCSVCKHICVTVITQRRPKFEDKVYNFFLT